jgi:hypothetical protein
MLRLALASALVGYLPGALLFRLPYWSRDRRAGLDAEERVFWAVLISLTWSVAAVLTLAAFERYSFARLLLLNGAATTLLLFIGGRRLRLGREAPRVTWTALVPAGLVALGLWLYFPPAEYVMGGKDPGVYMNEGIQIAQRGGLVTRDPTVAAVPESARDLFFPHRGTAHYYGVRFMGFFIQDPDQGTVIGQFPHGLPASIAVGYGLNGLSGARQTIGVWAMLGLVAVYLVGVPIFGRLAAASAGVLLAINVVQLWHGRYPSAEIAWQVLIFGSVLAFGRAAAGDRPFFGAVAGTLLGLQLFFRYEAILTIVALLAAVTLLPANRQRIGAAFGLTLTVVGGIGFWYISVPMAAYSSTYLTFTRDHGGFGLLAGALAALALRRWLRRDSWARIMRWLAPAAMGTILVVLAIYAYFFREPVGLLAPHDALSLRTFAWYVTPWGLLGAVIGMAILAQRRFWLSPALFMTVAAHAVFFFYKIRIVPEHFWSTRRFLTVLVPATALLVAGLVAWALDADRLNRWRRRLRPHSAQGHPPSRRLALVCAGLVIIVLMPLGLAFWRASDAVRHHVEYAGLIPHLEQLAALVGDDDLLIVEARLADSDLHVLALPLAHIYARQVLVLDSNRPSKRTLEDFVRWASTQYDRILFLGSGGTDLLSKFLSATALTSDQFRIPEYESPLNAYPRAVRYKEFDFGLYELSPASDAPSGPVDVAIGTLDDLHVVRFYAKEERADIALRFRWTKEFSDVMLLGVDENATEVVVWMSSGGRPSTVAPAAVTVSLDQRVLGVVTLVDEVLPYRFVLPPDLALKGATGSDPLRLRLAVVQWNPQRDLGLGDDRDLGVMVTRVEVR